MEVFAGYSENADWNVGRLLDAIEEMGDLDNTLIFYIWGDNGASMEGTITGSFNEMTFLNGLVLDAEQQLQADRAVRRRRRAGRRRTPRRTSRRPGRTPSTRRSSGASRSPATSAARAIRWSSPGRAGSRPSGELRTQFTHCIDVGPTILEAAGIPEPKTVDGIAAGADGRHQLPLHASTTPRRPSGTPPSTSRCSAAARIYKDGWWAASRPDRIPWDLSPETLKQFGPGSDWDPDRDVGWELYYLPDDFSQAKTWRRSTRTRSRSCRSCGGRRPSATACCR